MSPRPPASRRVRSWPLLLGVCGVLALLAAAHAVVWRVMSDRLEAGFADWAAARRGQGWRLEHGPAQRGGWPFAATLLLPRLRLVGGAAAVPDGVDWQAEKALLRVSLPRLDQLTIALAGRHELRVGGVALPFAADRFDLTLPIAAGVLPRDAEFAVERLRLGAPFGAVELRRLEGGLATMRTAVEGENAIALRFAATGIALPPGVTGAPGGAELELLAGELALTGPWPRGAGPAARAEGWRDGGGTLQVRELTLEWGAVTTSLDATVALDDGLQPMGAGVLRLRGGETLLEAAADAGAIDAGDLKLARTVLRMLEGSAAATGGPPEIALPLTLEDRSLSVARIPVGLLPAWRWPPAVAE